jgi:hypothetical protein
MRIFNALLLALLLIQVTLVALVHGGGTPQDTVASGAFANLDRDALTELTISDGENNHITLEQGETGWRLPASWNFPIDRLRLKGLLDSLEEAPPALPVAVSEEARSRFLVARDKFERHLVFKAGSDVVADLYLGKSAGAGRVYARLADQSAIRDLEVPIWRASAKPEDWLDTRYLEPSISELKEVALPGVTLIRDQQRWTLADLKAGRVADQGKIQALLDRLRTLVWEHLEGTTASLTLPEPTFTMTLTPTSGEPLTYRFYQDQVEDKPRWRATRSDGDYLFSLDAERVTPLRDAAPEALSHAAEQPDDGNNAD